MMLLAMMVVMMVMVMADGDDDDGYDDGGSKHHNMRDCSGNFIRTSYPEWLGFGIYVTCVTRHLKIFPPRRQSAERRRTRRNCCRTPGQRL